MTTTEPTDVPFYIHPQLRGLAVPIASLSHDPKNARKHGKRNLEAIASSLREHGQRKPLVVQETPDGRRIVRAGNGTMEAARMLGWTQLAVVLVAEDDRAASRFALRDNRTAELAEWDEQVLVDLLKEHAIDDLPDVGFTEGDLSKMLGSLSGMPKTPKTKPAKPPSSSVREVKLALSEERYREFMGLVSKLGPLYGTENITDTVVASLRDVANRAGLG